MIVFGRYDTHPLPEKPRTRDEATDRGFDPDSILHDRAWAGTPTDPELLAVIREQAHGIQRMRDEDRAWRSAR